MGRGRSTFHANHGTFHLQDEQLLIWTAAYMA